MQEVTLSGGNDVYTVTAAAGGITVHALAGNDVLRVSGSLPADTDAVVFDGGDGDDLMYGGAGANSFIGGAGTDRAFVALGAFVYGLQRVADGSLLLTASTGNQRIDPSTETVQFSSGQVLAFRDIGVYVGANEVAGPFNTSQAHFTATDRLDVADLSGNVRDYTFRQLPDWIDPITGLTHRGDTVLSAINGTGDLTFAQGWDAVRFKDGQYLAIGDLASYVQPATADVVRDRTLYYFLSDGYIIAVGGAGADTLVIADGAMKDYTVRQATGAIVYGPETIKDTGASITGLQLVATNGNGAVLIDPGVEKIRFNDGTVSYADLTARIAASPVANTTTLHTYRTDTDVYGPLIFSGGDGADQAYVGSIPAVYQLTRDAAGDFVLTERENYSGGPQVPLVIAQSIEVVQFNLGQYLALGDLPAYIRGDPTFTTGTAANDLLFALKPQDQYITGGGGSDTLYLNGNVNDYVVRVGVDVAASGADPAIHGLEFLAYNGSGDLYIDSSVERIQFANGLALSYDDIFRRMPTNGIAGSTGTNGDDTFVARIAGDQYFNGGSGSDSLYVHGNIADYTVEAIDLAATAGHPAIHGYELIATNGSGNLYLDTSIEMLHFQNGETAPVGHLPDFF